MGRSQGSSWRPGDRNDRNERYPSEPVRQLVAAMDLKKAAWNESAQALSDFLDGPCTQEEIDQAIEDALHDRSINRQGVSKQRLHVKLYFAVWRHLRARKLPGMPWYVRDVDNLVRDLEMEREIRDSNVDVRSFIDSQNRNGAFDHLTGLTASIATFKYLLARRRRELAKPRPTIRKRSIPRAETHQSDQAITPPRSSTPVEQHITGDKAKALQKEVPKGKGKEDQSTNQTQVEEQQQASIVNAASKELPRIGETRVVAPVVQSPVQSTATASARPEHKVSTPLGASVSKVIIQQGLDSLSGTNMMPSEHQYDLFNAIIPLLERSCFFWAEKTIPEIMAKKKWTTWKQVHILKWLDLFAAPDTPLNVSTKTKSVIVGTIVPSLRRMQNDAITRPELSIVDVAQMMKYAQTFAKVLKDEACLRILTMITERLTEIENRALETRRRSKQEFQNTANAITKKYMKMMEDEIEQKAMSTHEELENNLEACDWNLDFELPSEEYYAGKVNQNQTNNVAVPVPVTSIEAPIDRAQTSTPGHIKPSGAAKPPVIEQVLERQASEPESVGTSGFTAQGPPERGTIEHELFWTAVRNNSTSLPVTKLKDALDIDPRTWEELRKVAAGMIERNDLIDLRWKDIQERHPAIIQSFMALHLDLFKQFKTNAFMDILCEITFHSAHRGIVERRKRERDRREREALKQLQRPTEETHSTLTATSDPRIRNREAQIPRNQEETQPSEPASPRDDAAAASRAARLAQLQQQGTRLAHIAPLAPMTNIQPTTEHGRTARRSGQTYFGPDASTGQTPQKRALSPSGDRTNTQKRVKTEQQSQEDALAHAIPSRPNLTPRARAEGSVMSWTTDRTFVDSTDYVPF